jgi:hypothetical protein
MPGYNLDVIKQILSIGFDVNAPENQGWIAQISNAIKTLADSGTDIQFAPDIIVKNPEKYKSLMPQFFDRFKTFLEVSNKEIAAGKTPTFSTIADYVKGEKEYVNALKSMNGFSDLANIQSAQEFIKNDVSLDEVKSRVTNALYAVKQADPALRAEINKMYPNVDDNQLAKVLVTGNIDAATEALKINQAGINVSAQNIPGYNVASDTYALAQQGITRTDAAKAFGAVSENLAGMQQAANIFGETTTDLQKQLEEEQLGISSSKKISGLASQARAQFEGTTGVRSGSLAKPTTGKL